jgi:hypothetical protein
MVTSSTIFLVDDGTVLYVDHFVSRMSTEYLNILLVDRHQTILLYRQLTIH